jgi:hypothetical protein
MDKNIKLENLTNSELELLKKQKRDEFETVRHKIVQIYNYWESIERDYKDIDIELNRRNVKTKI